MGKDKNKDDVLVSEAYLPEGMLCGLFWKYPDLYAEHSEEKLNKNTFGNYVYAFYFSLGRRIYQQGFSIFDDTCTYKVVNEFKAVGEYEKLGGFETIQELMEEAEDKKDNIEGYYETVKKYEMLRQLREILGDKVIEQKGKYDYRTLNGQQIHRYWIDVLTSVAMDNSANIEEKYLLDNLDDAISRWDSKPDIGLEFYNSPILSDATDGWSYGDIFLNAMFSGNGKTSFMMNKLIISCILNNEKLLLVANEQSESDFQKLLLVTAMGILGIEFDRKRLNKGGFSEKEKKALHRAKAWLQKIVDNNNDKNGNKLISIAFMEDFTIDGVKTLIRHYANRGYRRVIIDTGRPSDGARGNISRWEQFYSDITEIYKLTRINGNGLGLSMWINVQSADSALLQRWLDESALAESKKIKNLCSVLTLMRPVWQDEFANQDYELEIIKRVKIADKDEFNGDGEILSKPVYKEIKTTLDPKDGPYYLLFTAKNRRGMDQKNGLPIIVYKPVFNTNQWDEVGVCYNVRRDKNYNS